MTTELSGTGRLSPVTADEPVRIRAHRATVRKLGHWTSANRFDVRASQGTVLLDLRTPRIPGGDIMITLDIDRAAVKLLVPDNVTVDAGELRRIGRGGVSDWTQPGVPDGRRIVLLGELRSAEIRVRQGGVAMLAAMLTREYLTDARQARREGRYPTIDDPGRAA